MQNLVGCVLALIFGRIISPHEWIQQIQQLIAQIAEDAQKVSYLRLQSEFHADLSDRRQSDCMRQPEHRVPC